MVTETEVQPVAVETPPAFGEPTPEPSPETPPPPTDETPAEQPEPAPTPKTWQSIIDESDADENLKSERDAYLDELRDTARKEGHEKAQARQIGRASCRERV